MIGDVTVGAQAVKIILVICFEWKLGSLPEGYDHKYIYTHLGYNLKPLDVQAAIGREQLKKSTLLPHCVNKIGFI